MELEEALELLNKEKLRVDLFKKQCDSCVNQDVIDMFNFYIKLSRDKLDLKQNKDKQKTFGQLDENPKHMYLR